jgi:hypothetical protein
MKRRVAKDLSVEEFDAWAAAADRVEAVSEAASEEGGPRLSLVPAQDQNEPWPTDLLPPAAEADQPAAETEGPHLPATPFDGIELDDSRKRLAGWSADRQRLFLSTLAETGSVHLASKTARLSARSAYRLRTRSPAFARTWDIALQLAVGRLGAIVFDRAINGRIEQVYQDGNLVAERRVPSDKLLTWLLARLDPKRFALPWEQRGDSDPQAEAVSAFPALLDTLADTPA